MKIKCPACSTTLDIPAAAAGKVVKCPCGQQLKAPPAPAGKPTQATAPVKQAPAKQAPAKQASVTPSPATPALAKQVPAKPAPAKKPAAAPVAQPAAAGADLFDQLTEDDYQPIKSVGQPGKKPPAPTIGENTRKLLDQAQGNEGKKSKRKKKKSKKKSTNNGDRRSFPGAIVCFVLAVAATGAVGFLTYKWLEESTFADEASRIIGMSLLPVIFLVVGIVLMGRKKE